ncbi:hypothetical protein HPB48_013076 [Haemaphysalis longicornis]|uniref:Uncharacterized protein n=1 Tax=Haemaphysalis longicornis TaxID=44386 RepID=A0A9J6G3R9_HAELO|nr:hypothetical protein HPB48_013076 [Haemaphysalis longicornis]
MKFTDYTYLSNINVGPFGFFIHQAAGLSKEERAETFIKVRKPRHFVSPNTFRTPTAHKFIVLTKLTQLRKPQTVTPYKALDPATPAHSQRNAFQLHQATNSRIR